MKIITTHSRADMDALASVFAAKHLHPDAQLVLPRRLSVNVSRFLSLHQDVLPFLYIHEVSIEEITSIIVVDANRWDRLEFPKEFRDKENLEIEIWDHHAQETDMNPTIYQHSLVGACTTLVVREIERQGKSISAIEATLFLSGIYEDTGGLLFANVTAEDYLASAFLIAQHADIRFISAALTPNYEKIQTEILETMLKEVEKEEICGRTVVFSLVDLTQHVEQLAPIVQLFRGLVGVHAVFALFTRLDKGVLRTSVIARSNPDIVDVGRILKELGGGGHRGAASAAIKEMDPEEIEEEIRKALQKEASHGVTVGDLMSFPVTTVSEDLKISEVVRIFKELNISGAPVIEKEMLVGVISKKDLKKIIPSKWEKTPVKAVMNRNPLTVDVGESPFLVVRMMVEHNVGRLLVMNKGSVVGIITRKDTLRYFYDISPTDPEF